MIAEKNVSEAKSWQLKRFFVFHGQWNQRVLLVFLDLKSA